VRGGAWKDTLISYNLDPRTDPKYRVYQTLAFHSLYLDPSRMKGKSKEELAVPRFEDHIFNGQLASAENRTWQLCDISDPLIQKLVETAQIPATYDVRFDFPCFN
jgi:general transcription factor 3C polypeptide 5 (transcription factor C subunit 1)